MSAMPGAGMPAGDASAATRTLSFLALVGAAWRRLTVRHWTYAAALGVCLTPLWLTLGSELFSLFNPEFLASRVELVLMTLVGSAIDVFSLLVCLAVADQAVAHGARRPPAYALAAVAGALLASTLTCTWFTLVWLPRFGLAGENWVVLIWPSAFMNTLVLGGGATILYANLRQARESLARLNQAELERAEVARVALGARLNAMRARVEPQFLFDTLAQVKQRYDVDPARAGLMLDGLIAYLRAAMPQMRHVSSTVDLEVDLARAYLDVMAIRAGRSLAFAIAVAEAIGEAAMPPMLLLPLVETAMRMPESGERRFIDIRVASVERSILVSVSDTGDAFDPERVDDTIRGIRERLHTQYGSNARLDLERRAPHGTEAVMEIPHERTQSRDR